MEVLRERVDPEPFLRDLSDAPERALLLETGHSRVVIEAARDAVPEAGSA